MRRTPSSSLLFYSEGSVITTLANFGNTVAFSELDFSESLSSIHLVDINGHVPGTRIVVADYPVPVHSIDLNEDLIVFLKPSQDQFGLSDVNVYLRLGGRQASQFNPQPGSRITSIKLLGGLLVSSSTEGCLVLTSLANPSKPRNTLELADSGAGAVLDLGVSQARILALSEDSTVRVWKTDSENCVSRLSVGNENMSKISVSWPYCIIAGQNTVELWDLEKEQFLQRLEMSGDRVVNVLNITSQHILVGDLTGSITVWSLLDLLDGHKPEEEETLRSVQCLDSESSVSGICSLSADKILVAGWSGKCSLLGFV